MKNTLTTNSNGFFLDPLFDLFGGESLPEPRSMHSLDMKTDIKEDGANYLMQIDLPGVNKKDIKVSLNDGYLTVEAKVDRENNEKDKKGNYVHRERFSGIASRSYYVGEIEQKSVNAAYENGVLTLSFPKEEEKKLEATHQIEVK
ncbi:MAG: Hsp20/alpha crystallin family protein [Bacilli bacterium]|jgi:HSP20 family molecular chaperone IbpA|nr:Hsp20/alpha crystallin family protein [Bacilli bacterium]MCH4211037.1 Hsp20/alpha crystallin family protein [Bacilli bacterium]MCH4228858.1 Hsp20/alpha crystallin family protein [Bacilli bacterium]MCH4278342.1 Hsp20/alpha crystallin family protein [Bacilli bacterium]MCI2055384.1 Hsp20/alpha crystallin family protein [Bacilli bacterium]